MYLFNKLQRKIGLAIFVFTVIPLSMVVIASYMHSAGALRDSSYDQLQTALELKCNSICRLFESWELDALDIASHPYIITGLAEFSSGFRELGAEGARSLYLGRDDLDDAGDDSAYSTTHNSRHGFFVRYAAIRGYEDVFLIDLEGNIIYATRKDECYGTNLLSGPLAGSNLAELHKQLRTAPVGKIYTADTAPFCDGTTDEVAQILNEIQTGTDSVVRAMTETADMAGEAEGALGDIVKGILNTTDRVQTISSMAAEQSDRLQEITDMFTLQGIA